VVLDRFVLAVESGDLQPLMDVLARYVVLMTRQRGPGRFAVSSQDRVVVT
jgi:hypothetical protein